MSDYCVYDSVYVYKPRAWTRAELEFSQWLEKHGSEIEVPGVLSGDSASEARQEPPPVAYLMLTGGTDTKTTFRGQKKTPPRRGRGTGKFTSPD